MNFDAIDKYIEQLRELKVLEALTQENEDLRNTTKNKTVDEPSNILKTILANLDHPDKLQREWIDSGLFGSIRKEIRDRADFLARVRRSMETGKLELKKRDDDWPESLF